MQNLDEQHEPLFPFEAPLHIASQSRSSGSDVVFSVVMVVVVGFVNSVVSVEARVVVLVVVCFVVVVFMVVVVVVEDVVVGVVIVDVTVESVVDI